MFLLKTLSMERRNFLKILEWELLLLLLQENPLQEG
jgi:hypothetical protein